MGIPHHEPSSRDGPINLPIDFETVGLLKERSFSPLGLLQMENSAEITYDQLVKKVKTAALRQLNFIQLVQADNIEVFIKSMTKSFPAYIGPVPLSKNVNVMGFINRARSDALPLKVEVWGKNDMSSPSHAYFRSISGKPERSIQTKVLHIEASELQEKAQGSVNTSSLTKDTVYKFTADLLTAQCIRAFRKDFERRILECYGLVQKDLFKVEIFFQRIIAASEAVDASKNQKSKISFEEKVLSFVEKDKVLRVNFRILPATVRKGKETAKDASQTVASAISSSVPVTEKRSEPLAFGAKSAFGHRPASTAPPLVAISPATSAFNQFVRAQPVRMSDAGSATSFKTLHDGFYEAVKQASERVEPVRQFLGQPPYCPLSNFKAPPHASASTKVTPSKDVEEGPKDTTAVPAFQSRAVSVDQKAVVLGKVEQMLSTFMINLNQTLLANFGDDASTLSIESLPASQAHATLATEMEREEVKAPVGAREASTAAPLPNVGQQQRGANTLHNACCNICSHVIVGTRHKCANCPDWDCCDKCRETASVAHPGHHLMAITSNNVIRGSIRPKEWPQHYNIICDGCDRSLAGPRFKCIGCEDFDWCADCEADPSVLHNFGDHHIFLKINKPFESKRVEHFALQGKEIVGEMQEREDNRSTFRHLKHHRVHRKVEALPREEELPITKMLSRSTLEDDPMMENKGDHVVSLPTLTPEAKHSVVTSMKRSERADDENVYEVESKKTAKGSRYSVGNVQEQLAALTTEAQKLPGAELVPSDKTIKATTLTTPEEEGEGESEKEEYGMQVVSDVNMPDGTKVVAGSQFEKTWKVKNTGTKVWPASTCIRMTSSTNGWNNGRWSTTLRQSVAPEHAIEISVSDLEAGEQLGDQSVYFRLELPSFGNVQGRRFGQQFWCKVHIVDGSGSVDGGSFVSARGEKGGQGPSVLAGEGGGVEGGSSQQDGSDHSLGSSLFQLPKAPESVGGVSEGGAPTSTRTTTEGGEEEADSVISFASSDDDNDDEDDYEIIEPTSDGEDDDE
ncbi:hypothetical protein CBS101457_000804 [Exobasidium rhododendri]|nr:hypothetical protein CBS101457_000804 [Exobasidium rhododendri]